MSKISYDAIIIGAGFSGLYQLYKLRDKLKLNCRVLEKGSGIGGTWYWNRYPVLDVIQKAMLIPIFFLKKFLRNGNGANATQDHAEIRKYLNYVSINIL